MESFKSKNDNKIRGRKDMVVERSLVLSLAFQRLNASRKRTLFSIQPGH
jgi:hypothetical protein